MKTLRYMTDKEALDEIINHILGKDWHVVDSMPRDQVNAIAVEEIKNKWDSVTGKILKDKWNNVIDKLKFKI